ncbi:MAG: LolA family protein [Opitutales bacterium]
MRPIFYKTLLILGIIAAACSVSAEETEDARWEALFKSLPETASVEARFEEWRHSLLRDRPSYLKGVLRFDSELGVSLNYVEPSDRTIIIYEDSVAMRNSDGETSSLPDSERYNWIPNLIGTIFSFDLESWKGGFLLKDYSLEEEVWTAVIEPKEDTGRDQIREVKLIGDAVYVTEMEMRMKGGKRVNIKVASAEKNIAFSSEVKELYF